MGAAVVTLLSAPAAQAASPPGKERLGSPPVIPAGAVDHGPLAPQTPLQITITLRPRDPAALAAYANAVSAPGSTAYHQYLSVAQFASQFAPTSAQVRAVEDALRAQGLTPASISVNGLAITVKATAARAQQAFSTQMRRYTLAHGGTGYANTQAPAVPASVSGLLEGVLGLDSVNVARPAHVRETSGVSPAILGGGGGTTTTTTTTTSTTTTTTGSTSSPPKPCAAASATGMYTADRIAAAYRLNSLYQAGDLGARQTVALFELEPNIPSDISAYQSCYGTSAPVAYVPVDGGAGAFRSGDGVETELDVEDALGLAPGSGFLVYQGPNTNAGVYDTYNAIITQNRAKVISTSWGLCELQISSSFAGSENTLFQEAATQGQSIFAASGDSGSEDCGTAALGVDDPASQPYLTSVGGTSMFSVGPPPTQSVWNNSIGAGGGGISTFWVMPSFQATAASALNVNNSFSSAQPCHAASGYCREIPDVSADADPNTGYAVLYNGSWIGVGGTSAAAPTWAAFTALTNASGGCARKPVGFANPTLYAIAGSSYANNFSDIISGNNDFTGTGGGRYPAASHYDLATGLGTPIASSLSAALCASSTTTTTTTTTTTSTSTTTTTPATVTITNPGSQAGRVNTATSLQLHASDSDGGALTFSAAGLPPGLSINTGTGLISGAPTTAGVFTVTATARDVTGPSVGTSFSWSIAGSTLRGG